MMNTWYKEGLLDPEFYTRGGLFADMAKFNNGDFGALQFFYSMSNLERTNVDTNANFQGVSAPVKNKGDIRKLTYNSVPNTVLGGGNATMTTACADPVTLVKWMDFFYSEQGSLLGNWGVEGEAYTLNAQGEPEFSDLITKNPDGLSQGDAQALYTAGPIHPKLYAWIRGFSGLSEREKTVGTDIWDRNYEESQTMPEVTLTTDESAEYTSMMNDIKTYVEESTLKFIMGDKPLSEWDAFVEWINTHGIVRCTEIQQGALDRYNNR